MYAIIESCGRQYKVSEGDVVFFEKLDTEEGKKKVKFDNVVLVSDGKDVKVGAPYVKGLQSWRKCSITWKRQKNNSIQIQSKRKNYRRTQGHRQPYTKVEIKSIKVAE